MRKRGTDRSHTAITLEDLDNWTQALYEDFHGRCELTVYLPVAGDNIKPSAVVEVYTHRGATVRERLWRDWKVVELRQVGAIEQAWLHLLSRAWLELDLDRQAQERQAPLFPG